MQEKKKKQTCEFIEKLAAFDDGGELFFFLAFDAALAPVAVFLVRFRGFLEVGSSTGVGGNTWDGFMPPILINETINQDKADVNKHFALQVTNSTTNESFKRLTYQLHSLPFVAVDAADTAASLHELGIMSASKTLAVESRVNEKIGVKAWNPFSWNFNEITALMRNVRKFIGKNIRCAIYFDS